MGGGYGAPQGLFSSFSPVTALVTHMVNMTVQEGHLDMYNQAPCKTKTLGGPFILTDANMSNHLILKMLTKS